MKAGVAFADIFTGLYAVDRHDSPPSSTGSARAKGNISIWRCSTHRWRCWPIRRSIIWWAAKRPGRLGNAHPNIVPYQTFETADGYIIIAVGTDRQFRNIAPSSACPNLPVTTAFNSNRGRVENRDALIPLLDRADEGPHDHGLGRGPGGGGGTLRARSTLSTRCSPTPRSWRAACRSASPAKTGSSAGCRQPDPVFGRPRSNMKKPRRNLGMGRTSVLGQVLGLTEVEIAKLKDSGAIG